MYSAGVAKHQNFKVYEPEKPNDTDVDAALKAIKDNDPKLKELNLNNIKVGERNANDVDRCFSAVRSW